MDSEIREYEEQLAEVQAALKAEDSDELREVETELNGLIAELKKKVPKFQVGSDVIVENRPASVDSIIGTYPNYIYTVSFKTHQPSDEDSKQIAEADLAVPTSLDHESSEPIIAQAQTPTKSEKIVNTEPHSKDSTAKHTLERRPKSSRGFPTTRVVPETSPNEGNAKEEEPADKAYEDSRSKWRLFAQQKGKKKTLGPVVTNGVSKKPTTARRSHYAK